VGCFELSVLLLWWWCWPLWSLLFSFGGMTVHLCVITSCYVFKEGFIYFCTSNKSDAAESLSCFCSTVSSHLLLTHISYPDI
jgi:hypothetical protein